MKTSILSKSQSFGIINIALLVLILWAMQCSSKFQLVVITPDNATELMLVSQIENDANNVSVSNVAFHPSAPLLAIGWDNNAIWLLNIETDEIEILRHGGDVSIPTYVAFNPDGNLLAATGNVKRIVDLWDINTKQVVRSLQGSGYMRGGYAYSISFNADGTRVVAIDGNTTQRWNAESGERLSSCDCNDANILFSPTDPELEASCGLFDVSIAGVAPLWRLDWDDGCEPSNAAISLAFSTDGKTLAAGFHIGELCVWDVYSKQEIQTIEAYDYFRTIALNPDGLLLASTNGRDSVRLWETSTGELETTITISHTTSLAFSIDGTLLAIGTKDGVFELWGVPE